METHNGDRAVAVTLAPTDARPEGHDHEAEADGIEGEKEAGGQEPPSASRLRDLILTLLPIGIYGVGTCARSIMNGGALRIHQPQSSINPN